MKFLALFALVLTGAACAQPSPGINKGELESYLRHMEMWLPQIAVEIDDPVPSSYLPGFSEVTVHLSYNGQGKEEHYFLSADGKSLVKGEAFQIDGNPFQSNLDKVTVDSSPSYGPDTAPLKLVVFGDFQCPYCKAEAEVLRTNIEPTFGDQVQVIFKDFPLESIHPWARAASIAGRCVYDENPEAFWKFHDWIYEQQGEINEENLQEQVTSWANLNGVDSVALGRCIDTKASEAAVNQNIAEGRALGINGTPTLMVNGRLLPSGAMQWEVLKQVLQLELNHLNPPPATAEGE